MRLCTLLRNQPLDRVPVGEELQVSRLIVQSLERGKLLVTPELGFRHR